MVSHNAMQHQQFNLTSVICLHTVKWYYLPTPPLGQDMTHGQFLSGV